MQGESLLTKKQRTLPDAIKRKIIASMMKKKRNGKKVASK